MAAIWFESGVGYQADRAGYLVSRVRILKVKAVQEVCMQRTVHYSALLYTALLGKWKCAYPDLAKAPKSWDDFSQTTKCLEDSELSVANVWSSAIDSPVDYCDYYINIQYYSWNLVPQ